MRPHVRHSVAFALAVVAGSMVGLPIPPAIAVSAGVVALAVGSRPILVVIGFVVAAGLAADARSGLSPVDRGSFEGVAVIASDPSDRFGPTVVDLRTDLGRFEAVAHGAIGRRVASMTVGRRVELMGRIVPLPRPERGVWRHVRGRITIERLGELEGRELWSIPVEFARDGLARGAGSLPNWQRPVYRGFLLGDERGTPDAVTEEFERAGLSHLMVVSGANVSFLLLAASPLFARLPRRWRIGSGLVLLCGFAAVTRFEPSVLRAVAMAAVVLGASKVRVPAIAALADAVAIVVLLDPLIVWSLGFRLSVAATMGIVLLARPIERRVPGPRWIATAVAVTVAAQVGAAPLLVPTFGPIRLVSVPANVLAEPAAAFVMTWGCSVGVLAGVIGGPVGAVLQLPARVALWWITVVAHLAAESPSPTVDLSGITMGVAATLLALALRRAIRRRRGVGEAV